MPAPTSARYSNPQTLRHPNISMLIIARMHHIAGNRVLQLKHALKKVPRAFSHPDITAFIGAGGLHGFSRIYLISDEAKSGQAPVL